MARTVGAKGIQKQGVVAGGLRGPWVWFDRQRVQELLTGKKLLPLERCGADSRTLRLLRNGKQTRLRQPVFLALCRLLKVDSASLMVSDSSATGGEFRVDVTAQALATEFWQAAKQPGSPPPELFEMFRIVLNFGTWSDALWNGGTTLMRPSKGRDVWLMRHDAIKRLEDRKRMFCDTVAAALRMVIPSADDEKTGVRLSRRRAGALAAAFGVSGLGRLQRVGNRSSAASRAAAKVIEEMGDTRPPVKVRTTKVKRAT